MLKTNFGVRLKMYIICKYSETRLIRNTKGLGKCVGLYRMSEYSGFILGNQNTLEPSIFCQMSQDVGKLRCRIAQVPLYI